MPLEELVKRWQRGDLQGCLEACEVLWQRLFPSVTLTMQRILGIDHRPKQLAEDAFWAAMQGLDAMISEKEPLLGAVTGRAVGRREQVQGCSTERITEEHSPTFEWRGEEAFLALARRIWVWRCQDAVRAEKRRKYDERPIDPVSDDGDGHLHQKMPPQYGPGVEDWLSSADCILELLEDLATFVGRKRVAGASQDVAACTIIFIKLQLAEADPRLRHYSPEQIAEVPVEDLLAQPSIAASVSHIGGFARKEWGEFLGEQLGLESPAVDQRISRFRAEARCYVRALQKVKGRTTS